MPRKLSLAFLRLLFVCSPSPTALSGCWSLWKEVFFLERAGIGVIWSRDAWV